MHYTVSNQADTATVELSGPITFNDSQQFRALADMVEGCKVHSIKLDFAKVDFIDSAGLGMLLMLRETCMQRHLQLLLCAAAGQVEKVFKITRFDQLFTLQG